MSLALLLFLSAACSGPRSGDAGKTTETVTATVPMPQVPDSLKDAVSRAAWLAIHFWDLMDFRDHTRSLDTAFMEQSFANYASVLELTDTLTRRKAVETLLRRSATDGKVYSFLNDIAYRYLFDPESPVYSEFSYLPFAEYRLAHGEGEPERLRDAIITIRKNQPGSKVPDFSFRNFAGGVSNLLRPGSDAEIMLIFYEPDCERCHSTIDFLRRNGEIADRVSTGNLRIVMIYEGEDIEKWEKHARTLPPEWEAGIDEEGIIDARKLFIIRATPTIYMLKPDGTVTAKDLRL